MSTFDGFGPGTLKFLRGLSKNNKKAWFEKHRAEYDEHYIDVAKAFVTAAGERLQKIAPELTAEPRVNGSIFRINRDVRFSKDKTPYKDHLDLWFWEAPARKGAVSGFFFRLTAKQIIVGAGSHGFDKRALAAYRGGVQDAAAGKTLVSATKKVAKAGYELGGSHYKKQPRGVELDGDRGELIKHNALWVTHHAKHPAELGSKKIVTWCVNHWKKMAPVHRWLVDHVQASLG